MARLLLGGAAVLAMLVLPAMGWAQGPPGPPEGNPSLKARVEGLEQAVQALEALVDTQQQEIDALQTALDQEKSARESGDTAIEAALSQEISDRESGDDALQTAIDEAVPDNIRTLADYVQIVEGPINDLAGPHVIFEGANYHFRNGWSSTEDVNGLGNVIVGYNEIPSVGYWPDDPRVGSHNLVLGEWNVYTSYGSFVAGRANMVTGPYSSVAGGQGNMASGVGSSVSGGANNYATGPSASVSGGMYGWADSIKQSINRPAYDSGWRSVERGGTLYLEHNLGGNPDNYKVDVVYKSSAGRVSNAYDGLDCYMFDNRYLCQGAQWYDLNDQGISINRGNYDWSASSIRVRIWVTAEYSFAPPE